MPNQLKIGFLKSLEARFGKLKKLPNSLSLFEIGDGLCRIYIRYSKVHSRNQSFYGIRKDDLKQLEGFNSVICFLWDTQTEPLFIPYEEFEEVFSGLEPASDGQIKAQIYQEKDGTELYIANAGRFNVEAFIGWSILNLIVDKNKIIAIPDFSHSQIQTLIGSIGVHHGYDIWIPNIDRNKLDWQLAEKFICKNDLPDRYEKVFDVIKQVDVLWLKRGSSDLSAMFEVEHSTSIYSGLLRFNDLHLVEPNLKPKFSIVSNDLRRALFLRQINRPTFKVSGLSEICNFLEYKDVFGWFNRTIKS
ncbi:MAG TPA: hypothetical protein PLG25_00165 [bacterium]|nr:hypothetical protein [bacterium]HMZ02956.1 hypothetical protein [bacterium]HNB08234.1 hypothetical protein [bacterium]HND76567.1 hypothetical protein [bacterium]HNE82255.1 hypothetical protein [bacterium]